MLRQTERGNRRLTEIGRSVGCFRASVDTQLQRFPLAPAHAACIGQPHGIQPRTLRPRADPILFQRPLHRSTDFLPPRLLDTLSFGRFWFRMVLRVRSRRGCRLYSWRAMGYRCAARARNRSGTYSIVSSTARSAALPPSGRFAPLGGTQVSSGEMP